MDCIVQQLSDEQGTAALHWGTAKQGNDTGLRQPMRRVMLHLTRQVTLCVEHSTAQHSTAQHSTAQDGQAVEVQLQELAHCCCGSGCSHLLACLRAEAANRR